MLVGFDQHNYNVARNITAPMVGVTFRKVQRLPIERIFRSAWAETSFVPFSLTRVDLLHTWNRINWGSRFWGVSFEDFLPRFWLPPTHPVTKAAMAKLRSKNCRFIIPISEFARRNFLRHLEDSTREILEPKVRVVLPFQDVHQRKSQYVPPASEGPLNVTFIGADFFRKGGEPLLEAIEAVGDELDIRCHLISRISGSDHGSREVDRGHLEATKDKLRSVGRISWHEYLPPEKIKRLLEETHVGVLPTFQDSFGYSVLEFMAAGIPVITTDVNALPEFVDAKVGFRICVSKTDLGHWHGPSHPYGTKRFGIYIQTRDQIRDGLIYAFRSFRQQHSEDILAMSREAVERIDRHFSADARHRKLIPIYEKATRSDH